MESPLQLLTADAGIALLHCAQQAFFGCQQDTCSIGIDAAAFEHQLVLRAIGKRDGGLE